LASAAISDFAGDQASTSGLFTGNTGAPHPAKEIMSSQESPGQAPKHRVGLISFFGLIALVGLFSYLAISSSAFTKREKIAMVTWNKSPFWDVVKKGADDAARDFHVDLTFVESDPNQAAQDQHIHELLDSGVQGLGINPNNSTAQEAIINEAASKTVVVTFDSDAPNTNRRAFIGTNDYFAGQFAAEQVRLAIPDGGKVIILVGSVERSNGRNRRQGVIDDLLDRPFSRDNIADPLDAVLKGNTYQIVATLVDHGDHDKATQLVADAIVAHPDVKCIVGLYGYSGPAIAKAVAASGKKDQIKVIGFDASDEEQALVASGAIFSSVLQDQYHCGYETVRVLADMARGIGENHPWPARINEQPTMLMKADNIQTLRTGHMIDAPTTAPTIQ
jgi:ribose transport system substrate-binding protein